MTTTIKKRKVDESKLQNYLFLTLSCFTEEVISSKLIPCVFFQTSGKICSKRDIQLQLGAEMIVNMIEQTR